MEVSSFFGGIYLLKVNDRNSRARCEICSKLTIKTPERSWWRRPGTWCNSGTKGPKRGTSELWDHLTTRDSPQSLKVLPGTLLRFKRGTQYPSQSLKVEPRDPLQSVKMDPYNISSLLYLLHSRWIQILNIWKSENFFMETIFNE